MPKATITFNLPEEQEEYTTTMNAGHFHSVLWDFDQWLRGEIKYKDRKEFMEVRDKLYELIHDEGIEL